MTTNDNIVGQWLAAALRVSLREDGQTLAEYVMVLSFIAILVLGAVLFLPGPLEAFYSSVGSQI